MIFLTGAAGFIGANFVHHWLGQSDEPVLVLDALTYAGNLESLAPVQGDARYHFAQVDIGDRPAVAALLSKHRPRAIVHFAAESHVDRSIHGPGDFIRTNVQGTFASSALPLTPSDTPQHQSSERAPSSGTSPIRPGM